MVFKNKTRGNVTQDKWCQYYLHPSEIIVHPLHERTWFRSFAEIPKAGFRIISGIYETNSNVGKAMLVIVR